MPPSKEEQSQLGAGQEENEQNATQGWAVTWSEIEKLVGRRG